MKDEDTPSVGPDTGANLTDEPVSGRRASEIGGADQSGREDSGGDGGGRHRHGKRDYALPLSIFAMFLSLLAIFLPSEIILDFYRHPNLVVIDVAFAADSGDPTGTGFRVVNEGRGPAVDVELGVLTLEDDRISVMPYLGSEITDNESVVFRTFRVFIPHLAAGEGVTVLVWKTDERWGRMDDLIFEEESGERTPFPSLLALPSISFLRSRSGPGRVLATRTDGFLGLLAVPDSI